MYCQKKKLLTIKNQKIFLCIVHTQQTHYRGHFNNCSLRIPWISSSCIFILKTNLHNIHPFGQSRKTQMFDLHYMKVQCLMLKTRKSHRDPMHNTPTHAMLSRGFFVLRSLLFSLQKLNVLGAARLMSSSCDCPCEGSCATLICHPMLLRCHDEAPPSLPSANFSSLETSCQS